MVLSLIPVPEYICTYSTSLATDAKIKASVARAGTHHQAGCANSFTILYISSLDLSLLLNLEVELVIIKYY